jgi:hypothetical protein
VIRARLVTYTDHVRKFEWLAMARGKASDHLSNEKISVLPFDAVLEHMPPALPSH